MPVRFALAVRRCPAVPPMTVASTEAAAPDATSEGSEPRDDLRKHPLARLLVWPFAFMGLLQLALVRGKHVPSADVLAHFEAGNNLFAGRGYERWGVPETHFPPLTPITLTSLERIFGSDVAAMRALDVIGALAVMGLLVALAHRLWADQRTTVIVAWLAATVSGMAVVLTRDGSGSEGMALAAVLGAVWLVVEAASRRGWTAYAFAAGAGAAMAFAYLSRPEALLPGLVIGASLALGALTDRRRTWSDRFARAVGLGAAFALAMGLLIAPYLVFLHGHTGSWSPSSKSKDTSMQAWQAVARGDRLTFDRLHYAIAPDGESFDNETFPLTQLARQDPSGFRTVVQSNVRAAGDLLLRPTFPLVGRLPVFLLLPPILFLPALYALWRDRRMKTVWMLTAVGATSLVTSLAFFVQTRYLVAGVAVVLLFAGRGTALLSRRFDRRIVVPVAAVVGLLVALSTLYQVNKAAPIRGGERPQAQEQAAAGRWLKANTPEDARVMTRSFQTQAYSDRPVVALPAENLDDTLAFARRLGVRYLVADAVTFRSRRPELLGLIDDDETPGLRLVHEEGSGKQIVRIYELDPVPPESDLDPIPLGYLGDPH